MKILHSSSLALCMAALLCACSPGTTVVSDGGRVTSDGKSITLRADGQPNARISATGDLTIDGKPVAVNASQRALLRSYHDEMNAMTADGIAIGKKGAAMAGTAVTEVIKSAINGNGDQIDAKMEAEARKIEQQALQLCKRLATIKASQDALATQLPAFKPYATIDIKDVNDCGSDQSDNYATGKEVGGSLARAVKGDEASDADRDAAEEADAASAKR